MGIIYDIEGNVYTTVVVGTLEWMVENLKTTHYADGTPIPFLPLDADWSAEDGTPGHDGAYSYPNGDIANKPDYGLLYNEYAVQNAHGLAPVGWRIPTTAEYVTLMGFFGGSTLAGGHFKESGYARWDYPNTNADNSSGLTMVGAGFRQNDGYYLFRKYGGHRSSDFGDDCQVLYNEESFAFGVPPFYIGTSVRCVRDYVPATTSITTTLLPLMRGVTISQKSVDRITSTGLVPFVTFSINPGLGNCCEFLDMFINSTYKPSSVLLSLDKDLTDPSTVYANKITQYNPGWFYIHGFPKTIGKKVLIGKVLFVKILFDNQDLFYDLRLIKTGYRELLGG